jgi:hypothetical protein
MRKGKSRSKFNFAGGAELNSMGAAWFVGLCYALYIDPSYTNWIYGSASSLKNNRLETYKSVVNKKVHEFKDAKKEDLEFRDQFIIEFWLRKILTMNKLDKSSINEDQEKIKLYASQILSNLENYFFEGVLSEMSTNGKEIFFKLRGADDFFVKRQSEKEKDKYEEYNAFINRNYRTLRLVDAEAVFSIGNASAFKDFLMQAFSANKKIRLEVSAIGLLNVVSGCFEKIGLDEILCFAKIL